jgi:hypothetical protein
MRIQVVINQVPHAPAIERIGGNHLGRNHHSISNTRFPKERSLLSFFHRARYSKEHKNDDKTIEKSRTFLPFFPSPLFLKIRASHPP